MNPILNAILSKGFIKAGRGAKSLIKGAKEHPIAAGIGVGALASAGTGIARGEGLLNKNQDLMNNQFEQFDTSDAMAMSKQNISKWVKAGVDEDSAQWLGMIDTVHEKGSEIQSDDKLSNQFGTMLSAMNVNSLDLDLGHHNQKRKKAGFDPIQAPQEEMREGSVRY